MDGRSTSDPAAPWRWLGAAALLWAGCCLVFWPGYATYDTLAQYAQARAGAYDDWHPPIMAALWRTLPPLGGGAGPMLALQLGGWWLGLGLIAGEVARAERRRAALAVLGVGLTPPWLGWQVAVLKDAQMAGALLAAIGLIARWRLRGRSVPWPARVAVAVLLGYAVLVRANAIFAVAPLIALLIDARLPVRLGVAAGAAAVALLAAGPINHGLFHAEASGVERTEVLFDLAGIAVRTPEGDEPLTASERAAVAAKHCSMPFFWDPLGDEARCGADLGRLSEMEVGALYRMLRDAALRHPLAYARHRLSHFNSTERWLVSAGWPAAAPPLHGDRNDLGLDTPGAAASIFQRLGGVLAETPLAWPVAFVVLAAAIVASARERASSVRDMAQALAGSALSLEVSFSVLAIASDWRYHLWPTVATAVALLLVRREAPQRVKRVAGVALAIVLLGALAARWRLPAPPPTFAGMIAGEPGAAGLVF